MTSHTTLPPEGQVSNTPRTDAIPRRGPFHHYVADDILATCRTLETELSAALARAEQVERKRDDALADLENISEAFPNDSPHKHEQTGCSLLDDVRDALRKTKCRACEDEAKLGNRIDSMIQPGDFKCVECGNGYCHQHAVSHFTAGKLNRPLPCEQLEVANEYIADLQHQLSKVKSMYLAEWAENEALLTKAGVDFTPNEDGGKPISVAIEEIVARAEKAEREVKRFQKAIADKGGDEHSPTEFAYLAVCKSNWKHIEGERDLQRQLAQAKARNELAKEMNEIVSDGIGN